LDLHPIKTRFEHRLGAVINLAEEPGPVPYLAEADLDSPNSCKEPDDIEA